MLDFDYLFWLNPAKANAAGKAPIYLRLTDKAGRRTEVSTRLRCLPSQWDAAFRRLVATGRARHPAASDYNRALDLIEGRLVLLRASLPTGTSLAQLRAALAPAPPTRALAAPVPPPLLEALAATLAATPNAGSRATLTTAWRALAAWLPTQPEGPALAAAAFTSLRAQAWLAWLGQAQGRRPSAIKALAGHFYSLWRRAYPDLLPTACPVPPPPNSRAARTPAQRPRYVLSPAERERLAGLTLFATRAAVARDIYLAQYYLHGSRLGVVLELTWGQVELAAGRVRLRAEKGGNWQQVRLSAPLRALLLRYQPATPAAPEVLVFPLLPATYHGLSAEARFRARKLATGQVWRGLKTCEHLLELPGRLHSHTARHTLALDAYRAAGNDLRLPSQLLGHSSLAITEIYIRSLSTEELDAGAAAIYGAP